MVLLRRAVLTHTRWRRHVTPSRPGKRALGRFPARRVHLPKLCRARKQRHPHLLAAPTQCFHRFSPSTMGWLWGWGSSSPAAKDSLDPSLRQFLDTEAPAGPKPALPSKPAPKAQPAPSPSPPPVAEQAPNATAPAVPRESQFPDGRYAHLWKNYVPQHELENRGKSEQDRLRDIVDTYNDRRAEVGRVALENCALEYMAQFECFGNPNFRQMTTLCRAESRAFNRCYDVQAKFLKALGYFTMDYRSPEESERIQMHADTLYHQMLDQEAQIDKAQAEGKPIPQFESLFSKQNLARVAAAKPLARSPVPRPPATIDDEEAIWKQIKPEARERYEKFLAELPPETQEYERKALLGELSAQNAMAKQVEVAFIEERINRHKRREAGQATIGDTIKHWWGWG